MYGVEPFGLRSMNQTVFESSDTQNEPQYSQLKDQSSVRSWWESPWFQTWLKLAQGA
jgi:hypothetical protein